MNKNVKPSENPQKSNVSLQDTLSSSVTQKKHEITDRRNELIDIEVFDQWVDNLDSSTQESFCSFAADNNSVIECFLYARFLGYTGSIVACDLWVNKKYKKPDHRKTLLFEIEQMQEDIRKLR